MIEQLEININCFTLKESYAADNRNITCKHRSLKRFASNVTGFNQLKMFLKGIIRFWYC